MSQAPHRAVYRYFDPADRFVRIRVVGPREAGLRVRPGLDRRGYRREVIRACLAEEEAELARRTSALSPDDPAGPEELLYRLCVAVNPELDIRAVALPGEVPPALPVPGDAPGGSAEERRSLARAARGLERRLARRVVGQEAAVLRVARAVRRAAAGLAEGRRPLASLLLVGPTGVGKTELARALAAELGRTGAGFVRIDCAELGASHETSRLVGAPPGYVGHEHGGVLTDALLANPRSVVVLDEVEKAHLRLFDVLLGVLEEGALTDGRGRRARFDRAFLLMTSNAGAVEARGAERGLGFAAPGLADGARREIAERELERLFRPELLGRLDEVVHFRALTPGDAREIAALQLADLARRARASGARITWTPPVARWLAARGHDPATGARGIARVLRRDIEEPLAEALVALPARARKQRRLRISIRGGRPSVAAG